METIFVKRPSFSLAPFRSRPVSPFFSSDFIDFGNGDGFSETTPSLNITEEKNNYIIDLAAPGLKKEDFEVNIDGNVLTISSDKETDEAEGLVAKEFDYSSFCRSVELPDFADASKIAAKYDSGILHLTIPKKPEAQSGSQRIKVQ